MASHGKVFDLFDERFLKLQDVTGNVELFPLLVPYDNYWKSILLYRTREDHDVFLSMVQGFTDRMARLDNQELWSWFVQWKVEKPVATRQQGLTPVTKKPKISGHSLLPTASSYDHTPQGPHSQQSVNKAADRRHFDRELLKDQALQRILLSIVQIEDELVPNFIELLYQFIDLHEVDGYALRCAMEGEIPSLWDFEHHPTTLSPGIPEASTMIKNKHKEEIKNRGKSTLEVEQAAEESRRLQYREMKFGLQPPKKEDSKIPSVNVPKDTGKRIKYLAACYKSRTRAIALLREAGMEMDQIDNYDSDQQYPPLETPGEGKGKGLANYYRNGIYAQEQARLREKMKKTESLMSTRLDFEAEQAEQDAALEAAETEAGPEQFEEPQRPSVPAPLIPLTPRNTILGFPDPQVHRSIPSEVEEDLIDIVPVPLLGKLKSKLFAKSRTQVQAFRESYGDDSDRSWTPGPSPSEDDDEDGENGGGNNDNGSESDAEMEDIGEPNEQVEDSTGMNRTGSQPQDPAMMPTQRAPTNPGIAPYITNLNPEQRRSLTSIMSSVLNNRSLPNDTPAETAPIYGQSILLGNAFGLTTSHNSNNDRPTISGWAPPQSFSQAWANFAAPSQQPFNPLTNATALESRQAVTITPPTYNNNTSSANMNLPLHLQRQRVPTPDGRWIYSPSGSHSVQPNEATPLASINHSSLSPGLQNLSFGNPNNGQARQASATSPVDFRTPVTGHRTSTPQYLTNPYQTPTLSSPHPGIRRPNPPSPIKTTAFNSAANIISPIQQGIPIILWFSDVIDARHIRGGSEVTDAIMLGYVYPDSPIIEFQKAVFLPGSIASNVLWHARHGRYIHLESYIPSYTPQNKMSHSRFRNPHLHAYEKLRTVLELMTRTKNREMEHTKRWRTSPGMLTEVERGSVWEGWGLFIDRPIYMNKGERYGANRNPGLRSRNPIQRWRDEWEEARMREAAEYTDDEMN